MISELTEAGKLNAVIDRCHRLEQIVEAHRYAESGQRTDQFWTQVGRAAGQYSHGPGIVSSSPAKQGQRFSLRAPRAPTSIGGN